MAYSSLRTVILMTEYKVTAKKMMLSGNTLTVTSSHQADVRETIEDILGGFFGFSPSLQESVDEEGFYIYLHTDAYEELNEEQIEQLIDFNITDNPEETTEAIKRLFNLTFRVDGIWNDIQR